MTDLIGIPILHLGAFAGRLPERLADLGVGAPWFSRARVEPDTLVLELRDRALGAQRCECFGG
jgi:hypothetical protein